MQAGAQAFQVSLSHAGSIDDITVRSVGGMFVSAVMPYTPLLLMAFGSAVVLAVLANVLQFGVLFSPQLIAPNFAKLNPLSGLQRIFFSPQTLVQLAKQLLKLLIVILICWFGVKDNLTMLYALAHASPHDIIVSIEGIVFGIGVKVGMSAAAARHRRLRVGTPPARAVAQDDEDRGPRRAPPVRRKPRGEEARCGRGSARWRASA